MRDPKSAMTVLSLDELNEGGGQWVYSITIVYGTQPQYTIHRGCDKGERGHKLNTVWDRGWR